MGRTHNTLQVATALSSAARTACTSRQEPSTVAGAVQVTYTSSAESGVLHHGSLCAQNGGPPSSAQTARTPSDHQHIELP